MIPFITSRTSTWRLLPPRLAGGINGSTCAHSSSVRSLGYRNLLRNVRGSSPSTSVVPLSNQVTTLNHKRFKGFKMFSDGHLGLFFAISMACVSTVGFAIWAHEYDRAYP